MKRAMVKKCHFFFCPKKHEPRNKLLLRVCLPVRSAEWIHRPSNLSHPQPLRAHPLHSSGATPRQNDKPISHALSGLTEWLFARVNDSAQSSGLTARFGTFGHFISFARQSGSDVWRQFEFPTKLNSCPIRLFVCF